METNLSVPEGTAATSPFLDPAYMDRPYARLAELRAQDPIHRIEPLALWVVLRHDDVKSLFSDKELVTPDRSAWELHQPSPEGSFLRWGEDHSLFALPPAEHARLRRLFAAALTPRAVKRYEQQVRETVERFASPLRHAEGVVDLLERFANPIPNAVISRITGIPPAGDDEKRFCELGQTALRGVFPFADEATKRSADVAFGEIAAWVRELTDARRCSLTEDMVSDLIRAQDGGGDRLSDDEIVMTITGLLAAGSETTALGGMVSATTLLEHPEQMERLRREPELIPNAVSEILRFSFGFGSFAGPARYALRDFEMRGKRIRKGQMLMLSFDGAGRDPAVYEDPDRFDVTREVADLMTFGHGMHYCLGAHLARQEMGVMIEAMLSFLPPGSRRRDDLAEYRLIGPFRRPTTLPIEIGAR